MHIIFNEGIQVKQGNSLMAIAALFVYIWLDLQQTRCIPQESNVNINKQNNEPNAKPLHFF